MENDPQGERLSWGDTVFLHLEREGMPLNVASVSVFDGEIPFETCLHFVESKLPRLPRYLQRVVPPPLNIGVPRWESDPNFDIRNHVREAELKSGSDAELKALAGKIFSTVMDRQHPLWDITFVRGLQGKRTGMILRMHHCVADGIAGVGMINVLLDTDREAVPPPLPKKKSRLPVTAHRDPITSLVEGVADSYSDFVKRILSAGADLVAMAERMTTNGNHLDADEFSHLLPEIGAFTERLRFNVLYRGPQKFAWTDIPLAEVKAIRENCGTSVNDVILALVTATIRRYLESHGDRVKGRLLRLMVPVSLRAGEAPAAPGNSISLVPVTIPLGIRNPRKLLAAVHRRTEFLKGARAAELVSLAAGLIGVFPTSAQALAGSVISQIPFTPFNMVCTNVPGPQYPLYLLGHKMLRWYPYVPVGGEMAMNCAILSYDGGVYFGFSGDVHAAPDLRRLETFLKLSFSELRDAAGAKPPRRRTRMKTPKAPKSAPAPAAGTAIPFTARPASIEARFESAPLTEEQKGLTQMIA